MHAFLGYPNKRLKEEIERRHNTETVGGKWTLYDMEEHQIQVLDQYHQESEVNKQWKTSDSGNNDIIQFSTGVHSRFIPSWYMHYNNVRYMPKDETALHNKDAKNLEMFNEDSTEKYILKWTN